MVSCFAEELGLEQAWAPFYGRSVRYRHCGSRPVHENFPCLVLEDTEKGVCWAVQIAALGPWQIEISRISDFLNLSGGSPDCDSGWQRSVAPGETIRSISSLLTCFKGDVEQTLQRLHAWTEDHAAPHPEAEKDFPVSYNDFCTCWGRAAEEAGLKTAKALEGSGVRYFTLDAGWFVKDGTELGNWVVNNSLYPDGGLRGFLEKIRRKGFIPGIWFEFEVASPLSCPPLSFPHPAVIAAARDTHSSPLIIFFVIPYSSLVLDNMLSVCFFLFRLPLFLFVREYRDDNNQSRDNCLVIGGHIHNLQSVGQGCQDNGAHNRVGQPALSA